MIVLDELPSVELLVIDDKDIKNILLVLLYLYVDFNENQILNDLTINTNNEQLNFII